MCLSSAPKVSFRHRWMLRMQNGPSFVASLERPKLRRFHDAVVHPTVELTLALRTHPIGVDVGERGQVHRFLLAHLACPPRGLWNRVHRFLDGADTVLAGFNLPLGQSRR